MRSLAFILFFCAPYGFCLDTATTEKHDVCGMACDYRSGACRQCTDTVFDCREKQLTAVCSSYFNAATINMSHVILKTNELVDFSSFPATAERLDNLDISFNKFTAFTKADFGRFPGLRQLWISANKVKTLPKDVFGALPQLEMLYMNSMGLLSLENDTFLVSKKLDYLELADNRFTEVPANSFSTKNVIAHLDLSRNPITQLKIDDFLKLTKLTYLGLEGLSITQIRGKTFASLLNLQYINLEFNAKLNYIDEDAFGWSSRQPNRFPAALVSFSVGGCNLGSLDVHLVNWQGLSEANLKKNPWECDCTLEWMLNPETWNGVGRDRAYNETVLPMLKDIECESGLFKGRKIGDLSWAQLNSDCPQNKGSRAAELRSRTSIIVTILVVTLLVSCIAVVLGVLTYRRCVHKTPIIPQAVNPYRAIYNQGAVQSYEEGIDKEQKSPYEL